MLLWDSYVICGYISLRLDGRILSLNLVCLVEPPRMTRAQSVSALQLVCQLLPLTRYYISAVSGAAHFILLLRLDWYYKRCKKKHILGIFVSSSCGSDHLCCNCWFHDKLVYKSDTFPWPVSVMSAVCPGCQAISGGLIGSMRPCQWGPQRCPRSALRVCLTCYNEVTITGCNIGCSHFCSPHPPPASSPLLVWYLCMNFISQSRRQGRTCDNISCMTQARRQGRTCNILLKAFRFRWVCSRWYQVEQWVLGCCHADFFFFFFFTFLFKMQTHSHTCF